MTLTLGLGAAMSGLLTSQKGLDLTSHNIANVNTEGFTRKNFNPVSRVLDARGVGTEVLAATREVDDGLLRDIRREGGLQARMQALDDYNGRLQDLFGRPESQSSISHYIADIAMSFEALAVDPAKSTTQSSAADYANRTADKLNGMSDQLQELRKQVDVGIQDAVKQVNVLLSSIADLNDKIVRDSATGRGSADLEDKRDLALKQLGEMMDLQIFNRGNGAVIVYTTSGTSLVDNSAVTLNHTGLTAVVPWQSKAGGDFGGITLGQVDIEGEIRQGKLKGLLELRDGVLPDMQAELDELARTMRDETNKVHNRGTGYPSLATDLTGTRNFIKNPATGTFDQQVTIGGTARMVLFDSTGTQVSTDTVNNLLGSNTGTIEQIATAINTFISSKAGAGTYAQMDANGHLKISIPSTAGVGIAFRDEASPATNPPTEQDATIQFDADGNGASDQTVKGFSNFFGLNDFFVTNTKDWMWQSGMKTAGNTVGTAGTLSFSDETNGMAFATISVRATDTLADVAKTINNNTTLKDFYKAYVVPEGGNFRLIVKNIKGENFAMSGVTGSAATALGLERSTCAAAQLLNVRSDIVTDPQRISRGKPQWSTDLQAYVASSGDNDSANELSELFAGGVSYGLAGKLSGTVRSMSDYAASIVSQASSEASSNKAQLEYQRGLTEALQTKSAEHSGVNLDEELSRLMVYQQSYSAAAKVIQTTQAMLDVLTSLIR